MKNCLNLIKKHIGIPIDSNIKNTNAGRWFNILNIILPIIAIGVLIYFLIKTWNFTDLGIVSLIVFGILGLFRWGYYSLVCEYLNIKNQLADFSKSLENINNISSFTENYYEIKDCIKTHENLSNIWHEFCETLIPEKENNEIIMYKNTAQTELYINKEALIEHQMCIGKYESLPGILTGLGLVGTFIAITVALMGFNLNSLDKSVENMLSGLSVKFISSLAGIITSIAFIIIKDHLLSNLEKL